VLCERYTSAVTLTSEAGATSRAAPGEVLPLPNQLSWSPLPELGGGDASMVAAGERRQKGKAAVEKGNV